MGARRETVAWTLGPNDLKIVWRETASLYDSGATLQLLLKHGIVKALDVDAVKDNLRQQAKVCGSGGEAEVHFVRWHAPDDPGMDGMPVALKIYHRQDGRGGFKPVETNDDAYYEAEIGRRCLRKEVNVMAILHHSGFSERVPPVLGVFQHRGSMRDPPLHGYVMPYYEHGSLAGFIRDTCDRRVPDSVFAGFFSPPRSTAEFSSLMQTLSRLHTGERGLMLQDVSSNNLLIQDRVDGSCRLLLGDPSMCFLISDLQQPDCRYFVSTWLWGTLAHRHKRFDPTADIHSLSFCFLELWLCAEGAPVYLFDLMKMTGSDAKLPEGRTFARALCVAILKRHASGSGSIVPRIRRELPVSWLQLWLLLLGTEDFASEEQLLSQQSHRRPAESDMVQASAELASVAADVEALDGGLTAASLATPEGEALVARCLLLHEQLTALSQLKPPKGSPLVPLDPSLSWVAKHFMSQDHPLVAAMRAAQAAVQKHRQAAFEPIPSNLRTFRYAVDDAQETAGCDPHARVAQLDAAAAQQDEAAGVAEVYQLMLIGLFQEYQRVRNLAMGLLPPDADGRQLLGIGHLDPGLQQYMAMMSELSGPAAAPAGAAAGQPASQLLQPAGPPPARPLAAAHQSMPWGSPASSALSLPARLAASLPAMLGTMQRQVAAAAMASRASAGVQPRPGTVAPSAGLQCLPAAGMPAQPAASAAAVPPGLAASSYGLPPALAAASAASFPPVASRLPQPAPPSPARHAFATAPSGHLPGPSAAPAVALSPAAQHLLAAAPPSAAAAAVPRSLAGSPPPSLLPQPLFLPAAAGGAGTPSTDLSAHTVAAGGSGNASPATSAGTSSPNKRKRGAEQGAPVAPGTILRFAASRDGCIAGLPAFRLPPHTIGSNPYAYMVARLSERFRGDVHQLLAQRQGPYAALLAASGLQPAQLDSLVEGSGSGDAYIEVSAASFLPQASAADHAAAAPIVFHSSSRGMSGSYEQQIECGGGSVEERAQYGTALQGHLKQSLTKDLPLAYGSGATATVLFRIAAAQLPQGAAAMAWVPHEWEVPAADLAAVVDRATHLFRKKK